MLPYGKIHSKDSVIISYCMKEYNFSYSIVSIKGKLRPLRVITRTFTRTFFSFGSNMVDTFVTFGNVYRYSVTVLDTATQC